MASCWRSQPLAGRLRAIRPTLVSYVFHSARPSKSDRSKSNYWQNFSLAKRVTLLLFSETELTFSPVIPDVILIEIWVVELIVQQLNSTTVFAQLAYNNLIHLSSLHEDFANNAHFSVSRHLLQIALRTCQNWTTKKNVET